MKALTFTTCLFVLVATLFSACSKKESNSASSSLYPPDTVTISHSEKGWEIYSWQQDGEWWFAILQGTNRLKNYPEVISGPLTVNGIIHLKSILDKFPEGEIITMIGQNWLKAVWGSGYYNLELPPESMISEITSNSEQRKLLLEVAE
jgi:hypothetical protein